MLKKIKSYLPSRNTSIFLGSIAGLVGLKQYDNHVVKQQQEDFKKRVAELADRPMTVEERPQKLIVFLHSPESTHDINYKATEYFIKYVKPIWDASAIDYEVVTEKNGDDIQKYVIKKLQLLRQGGSLDTPKSDINAFYEEVPSPVSGWVALGREAFGKVLLGIQDGACVSDLTYEPTPEVVTSNTEFTDEPTSDTKPPPPPYDQLKSIIPSSLLYSHPSLPTTLPPLGYVRFHHYYGFRYIPLRIYQWFTDRNYFQEIGQDALDIVLAPPRSLVLPTDYHSRTSLDRRPVDLDPTYADVFHSDLSHQLSLLSP